MTTPQTSSTVDLLCDALRREIRRTVTISATEQEVYVSRRAGVLLDAVRTRLIAAAALEAEVARLTAALAEAHTDANALAAGVLIAQGMHDDAEQLGLHATGEQVDGAIGRAVRRVGGGR